MSELTREEVRAACEAVHWERNNAHGGCWLDGTYFHFVEHRHEDGPFGPSLWPIDAIALLEATGRPFQIRCAPRNRYSAYAVSLEHRNRWQHGPDLPTAVVRAVNAWAEAKRQEAGR